MNIKSLYKVKKNDLNKCAQIIATSFKDDPLMLYFLNNEEYNTQKITYFYNVMVSSAFEFGHIYATSKKLEGIIIWFPENASGISISNYIKHGGLSLSFNVRFGIQKSLFTYNNFSNCLHKKYAENPHWYLFTLAVQKKHQKKGFSSKLLTPFLKEFDEKGIFCYLETHKKINTDIYKHFDFKLLDISNIPKTNLEHFSMLRSPHSHLQTIKTD